MIRTSARSGVADPSGSTRATWSSWRSFACAPRGSSPISSRNSVPPSAAATLPGMRAGAPSSARPRRRRTARSRSSVSGSAAQLSSTNGPPGRGLLRAMARASWLLPVPRAAGDEDADVERRDQGRLLEHDRQPARAPDDLGTVEALPHRQGGVLVGLGGAPGAGSTAAPAGGEHLRRLAGVVVEAVGALGALQVDHADRRRTDRRAQDGLDLLLLHAARWRKRGSVSAEAVTTVVPVATASAMIPREDRFPHRLDVLAGQAVRAPEPLPSPVPAPTST